MELEYPLQLDSSGGLSLVQDSEIPLQSVRQILDIRVGEVIYEPGYGSEFGQFESSFPNRSPVLDAVQLWLEPGSYVSFDSQATEQQIREDIISLQPALTTIIGGQPQ